MRFIKREKWRTDMRPVINKYHYALAGIILFFVSTNSIWLIKDQAPPMWDQAFYLDGSEVLYQTLTGKGVVPFLEVFTGIFQIKAPLIAVLPVPLYALLGEGYKSALLVNLAFLVLASLYLYKLGALIAGRKEAVLSIFILNTFPLIFAMSREFLVEYGLMTFVIIWMYYLIKSNDFEDKKCACLLGIILGLGMLMKISFFLYVLPPAVFLFTRKVIERKEMSRTSMKNILIILSVGILISGIWYFRNLPSIIHFAFTSGFGDTARNWGMGEVFSIKTILAYWTHIINYGISAYFFFLIILLVIVNFFIREKKESLTHGDKINFFFLITWFAIPFIVFTFGVNKDYRYTAPLWPAIALLMGIALIRISEKYGRAFLFILLIFPLLNYFYVSFSPGTVFLRYGQLELLNNYLAFAHPPIKERWPHKELVTFIYNDAVRTKNLRRRTTLLFNHPYLNFINLNYYSRNGGLNVSFDTNDYVLEEAPDETAARIERNSDYIFAKSGELGPDFANAKNVPVISLLNKGRLDFKQIGSIPLPDKTRLTIYKKGKRVYAAYPDIDALKKAYKLNTNNSITFSNQLKLLDYQITKKDGKYTLIFFWECLDIIERDYKVFVHVKDQHDNPLLNADHYPGDNQYPTYDWKKGGVIKDEVDITAPLPENVRVYIGVYEEATMSRLPVNNSMENDPVNTLGVRIF